MALAAELLQDDRGMHGVPALSPQRLGGLPEIGDARHSKRSSDETFGILMASFSKHANSDTKMPQSGRPKMKLVTSAADHVSGKVFKKSLRSQQNSSSSALRMLAQSVVTLPEHNIAHTTLRATDVTP